MEFSKKDRDLIIKIGKQLQDVKTSFEKRLTKLESVKQPTVRKSTNPVEEEKNHITMEFRNKYIDPKVHQSLLEAIHSALMDICEDNDITKLSINLIIK